MKRLMQLITMMILLVGSVTVASAQCGTWFDSPKENELTEAHVLYRDQVKLKNLDAAYDPWKMVYEASPAADGKRASHYVDGRMILKHKMTTADEASKGDFISPVSYTHLTLPTTPYV